MSGETQARRRKDKKKSRRDSISDASGEEDVKDHSEPPTSCLTVLVFLILTAGIGVLGGLIYIQSSGITHVPTSAPLTQADSPKVQTVIETVVQEDAAEPLGQAPPIDGEQPAAEGQPVVEEVVQVVEEHIVYVDQDGNRVSGEEAAAGGAPAQAEPQVVYVDAPVEQAGIQLEGSESEPPKPAPAEHLEQLPDLPGPGQEQPQGQEQVVVEEQEMRVRQVVKMVTAGDGSVTEEVVSEVPLTEQELQEEAAANQTKEEAVVAEVVEEVEVAPDPAVYEAAQDAGPEAAPEEVTGGQEAEAPPSDQEEALGDAEVEVEDEPEPVVEHAQEALPDEHAPEPLHEQVYEDQVPEQAAAAEATQEEQHFEEHPPHADQEQAQVHEDEQYQDYVEQPEQEHYQEQLHQEEPYQEQMHQEEQYQEQAEEHDQEHYHEEQQGGREEQHWQQREQQQQEPVGDWSQQEAHAQERQEPVPADEAYEHAEITNAEDWAIRDELDRAEALIDKQF